MELDLADSVAVVSGSTAGIGKAIALRLLEEGCRVVVTGRGLKALRATEEELERRTDCDRMLVMQADMCDPAAVDRVVKAALARWRRVDIAIANVGNAAGKPFLESTSEDWGSGIQANLLAGVELARSVVPIMRTQGKGVLLFISSIVAHEAVPAPLPYTAAKAALNAFASNLARTVAGDGVRVNVLSPGNVLFPGGSWAGKLEQDRAAVTAYIEAEVPMRRFGTPGEIADAAVFMCSERASFMTGACVVVDGGQTRSY